MSEPYAGHHAKLYDIFYSEKPYVQEAAWIDRRLKELSLPGKRLIDIACGTGRHALAFARLGYDVVGIDISESMIDRARSNRENQDLTIEFGVQDMRALDLPESPFDAAVCLFDSIGYVRTDEGLVATVQSVGNVLRPGGLFVFEFWHAPKMIASFDPVRVRRWNGDIGRILRVSETTLDLEASLARVTYTVVHCPREGSPAVFEETQTNRFFTVDEMDHFFTSSGLVALEWWDGFTDKPVDDETWHVVGVARKP